VIFDAWISKTVSTAIELAVLDGDDKIFLAPRGLTDPIWPGQYHMPGTVILPGGTFDASMSRLLTGEVGKLRLLSIPKFVTFFFFPMGSGPNECPRGAETGLLHIVRAGDHDDYEGSGNFYARDELPENIISFHRPMIAHAFGYKTLV
jgi:hypothetical protein